MKKTKNIKAKHRKKEIKVFPEIVTKLINSAYVYLFELHAFTHNISC